MKSLNHTTSNHPSNYPARFIKGVFAASALCAAMSAFPAYASEPVYIDPPVAEETAISEEAEVDTSELTQAESDMAEEKETENATLGKAYDMTDDQIRWIAACCIEENGADPTAIRFEASLVANLTDEGYWGSDPYKVINSSWFAKATRKRARKTQYRVTDEQMAIVSDVIRNGNRSTTADEHDCFSDIRKIVTRGATYTSASDIRNRSNYVPGNTVIYNRYGSAYVFECFPAEGSNPFGRRVNA